MSIRHIYLLFALSLYTLAALSAPTWVNRSFAIVEGLLFITIYLYVNRGKKRAN